MAALVLYNVERCLSASNKAEDSRGIGGEQVHSTRRSDVLQELRENVANWYTAASKWYSSMNSWRTKALRILEHQLEPDEYEDGDSDVELTYGECFAYLHVRELGAISLNERTS